jgi:hypothetical protein
MHTYSFIKKIFNCSAPSVPGLPMARSLRGYPAGRGAHNAAAQASSDHHHAADHDPCHDYDDDHDTVAASGMSLFGTKLKSSVIKFTGDCC